MLSDLKLIQTETRFRGQGRFTWYVQVKGGQRQLQQAFKDEYGPRILYLKRENRWPYTPRHSFDQISSWYVSTDDEDLAVQIKLKYGV